MFYNWGESSESQSLTWNSLGNYFNWDTENQPKLLDKVKQTEITKEILQCKLVCYTLHFCRNDYKPVLWILRCGSIVRTCVRRCEHIRSPQWVRQFCYCWFRCCLLSLTGWYSSLIGPPVSRLITDWLLRVCCHSHALHDIRGPVQLLGVYTKQNYTVAYITRMFLITYFLSKCYIFDFEFIPTILSSFILTRFSKFKKYGRF